MYIYYMYVYEEHDSKRRSIRFNQNQVINITRVCSLPHTFKMHF